jgi:hypothetical protein
VTNEEIDDLVVPFSRSIEKRDLLQIIFSVGITTKINENLHHLK